MDAYVAGHPRSEVLTPPPGRRIEREAEDRLRRRGYLALWDVSCDARDGVVRLRGRVPSYYLKQVAQAEAAEVEGVRRVVNRIEVTAPSRPAAVGRERATVCCDGLS
jgi:osmotically-inducible protein OsmY